ncbi:hypothetical protein JOB18_008420 [Solea senegalensis]|uniref:Uncharacterized protein n=1 Tax=Solea senegalensis TaxID=28829 RepID=A0AAV6QN43_SOLSE|nr:hypothetical protein JOB18_008420 [Solea senegalensis]
MLTTTTNTTNPPSAGPPSRGGGAWPRAASHHCSHCSAASHKEKKKKKAEHPASTAPSRVNTGPVSTNKEAALCRSLRLHGDVAEWGDDRTVENVQMTQSDDADVAGRKAN